MSKNKATQAQQAIASITLAMHSVKDLMSLDDTLGDETFNGLVELRSVVGRHYGLAEYW